MCGLAGYFSATSKVDTRVIREMMLLQQHRGPDDNGFAAIRRELDRVVPLPMERDGIVDADIIIGFNRLSILDLSKNGHQPMLSDDESVVLMLNGEIYNAFEIRPTLAKAGCRFKSNTDTEVVLWLYLEYGIERTLEMLNGMFAIVIYDCRIKTLFLARDRFGIKPLYVYQSERDLAFSSEIKSFTALPGIQLQLENSRIDEFLLFRNLINQTSFRNIENIEPGTYYAINRDNAIQKHSFFDLNSDSHFVGTQTAATAQLESAFSNAIKRQMISDVKLGCQLSGGVDSSLVAYYAQQFTADNLETISIIPDDQDYSEEEFVDQVQRKLNLVSHKYSLTSDYFLDNLEKASWHFEQPLNHPNTVGIYQLSQQAKQHVTVLLSGEGADEVFGGYSRFISAPRNPLVNRWVYGKLYHNRKSFGHLLPALIHQDGRFILGSIFSSIDAIKSVYPHFNLTEAMNCRKKLLKGLSGDTLLRQRKYELKTYLPDLLMRQDKMSMAHSIENRVPFLDNDLVTFALTLPPEIVLRKSNSLIEKNLIKSLASKCFSEPFAYRPKQGFGVPLKRFFTTVKFQERWNDDWLPGMRNRGLFEVHELGSWMRNAESLNALKLDILWLMISFEIWAKQYID